MAKFEIDPQPVEVPDEQHGDEVAGHFSWKLFFEYNLSNLRIILPYTSFYSIRKTSVNADPLQRKAFEKLVSGSAFRPSKFVVSIEISVS